MGIFDFLKRKPEIRADTFPKVTPPVNDVLLRTLLDPQEMTKEKALEIPTVQACITLISNTISRLPLQLMSVDNSGKVTVVDGDHRCFLLNYDTGDTLTAKMFWRAMIEDYYLGKGGFAYINKRGRFYQSINYVDEKDVSIGLKNFDPIFKEYSILVNGEQYVPSRFLKILRKTHDGMSSNSIVDENPLVLGVAYEELKFELSQARKGGTKRGFLQTDKPLTQPSVDALKEGFRRLYGSSDENVVILNNGVQFKDASATPQELQINENKESNSQEICKLFGIPASMICGSQTGNSMTDNDMNQFIRACVAVMTDIECSLNRDLLMETEKGCFYWRFDTKELTRGSIKERYEAYRIGLEKNFLQIDEVRQKEDMEPIGIDWLQMNLNTVLYNPKTKEIYTPNTNASMNLASGESSVDGKEPVQSALPDENRANSKNLIVTGPPGAGKTTWVESQMRKGDIVLDLDKVRSALLGTDTEHEDFPELTHILSMIRWAVYKGIEEGDISGCAYLITSEQNPAVLDQWKAQLNAEIKYMDDITPEECKERIKNDPERKDKELYYDLVDKWFAEHDKRGGERGESGAES